MVEGEAQKMATDLGYAPLPADVARLVRERIRTLKVAGRPS
jgi:hypothetical protein